MKTTKKRFLMSRRTYMGPTRERSVGTRIVRITFKNTLS